MPHSEGSSHFYTGNQHFISIPVAVSHTSDVSITLTSNSSYFIIGIKTSSGSNLETRGASLEVANDVWNVDNKYPDLIKTTPYCTLLYYKRHRLTSYNLSTSSVQRKYAGPDLVEYLQTSKTHFGTLVKNQQSSRVALLLTSVGFGAGLFFAALNS
jgi:hypothetical protein